MHSILHKGRLTQGWLLNYLLLTYLFMHLSIVFPIPVHLYRLTCPRNPSNQITTWMLIQLPTSNGKVLLESPQNAHAKPPTCSKKDRQTEEWLSQDALKTNYSYRFEAKDSQTRQHIWWHKTYITINFYSFYLLTAIYIELEQYLLGVR